MVVILTLIGLLSALGLIYLLKSDSNPPLSYGIITVFLSFLPLVLIIALELANLVYLNKKKNKLEQQEAELRQAKIDIINRRFDASVKKEQAKASVAPPVTVEVKAEPVKSSTAPSTSSLYSFYAPSTAQPTSSSATNSLYNFASSTIEVAPKTVSSLYSFS